jgi:hypothetical protein
MPARATTTACSTAPARTTATPSSRRGAGVSLSRVGPTRARWAVCRVSEERLPAVQLDLDLVRARRSPQTLSRSERVRDAVAIDVRHGWMHPVARHALIHLARLGRNPRLAALTTWPSVLRHRSAHPPVHTHATNMLSSHTCRVCGQRSRVEPPSVHRRRRDVPTSRSLVEGPAPAVSRLFPPVCTASLCLSPHRQCLHRCSLQSSAAPQPAALSAAVTQLHSLGWATGRVPSRVGRRGPRGGGGGGGGRPGRDRGARASGRGVAG